MTEIVYSNPEDTRAAIAALEPTGVKHARISYPAEGLDLSDLSLILHVYPSDSFVVSGLKEPAVCLDLDGVMRTIERMADKARSIMAEIAQECQEDAAARNTQTASPKRRGGTPHKNGWWLD